MFLLSIYRGPDFSVCDLNECSVRTRRWVHDGTLDADANVSVIRLHTSNATAREDGLMHGVGIVDGSSVELLVEVKLERALIAIVNERTDTPRHRRDEPPKALHLNAIHLNCASLQVDRPAFWDFTHLATNINFCGANSDTSVIAVDTEFIKIQPGVRLHCQTAHHGAILVSTPSFVRKRGALQLIQVGRTGPLESDGLNILGVDHS